MTNAHRSWCPINLSLEVFGDKWSLLILRDMIFGGRRHFRELLNALRAERSHSYVEDPKEDSARDPGHFPEMAKHKVVDRIPFADRRQ